MFIIKPHLNAYRILGKKPTLRWKEIIFSLNCVRELQLTQTFIVTRGLVLLHSLIQQFHFAITIFTYKFKLYFIKCRYESVLGNHCLWCRIMEILLNFREYRQYSAKFISPTTQGKVLHVMFGVLSGPFLIASKSLHVHQSVAIELKSIWVWHNNMRLQFDINGYLNSCYYIIQTQ